MTTMTDVARAIGVSIQTVSAVINDKPGISEATRGRVQRAISELDYHPNGLASSLRSQRSLTVGVLVPSITNPYWPGIVRGAEDVAHRNGYSILLCNTDGDPAKHLTYIRLLRRQRVAGLFSMSGDGGREEWKIVEQLVANGVPVALGGGDRPGERIVTFDVDDRRGGYTATAHLLERGHRRVGVISGPAGAAVTADRIAGYRDALRERSLAFDARLIVPGGFDVAGGQAGVNDLMRVPVPPTAIVAANDLCAIGAITALKRLGKKVPRDVAIVGFDDIEMAALYDPSLTTIAQPLYDMGAYAMQAILDRLHTPDLGGEHTVFDTQLVVRRSTVMSSGRHDEEPRPGATTRNRTP